VYELVAKIWRAHCYGSGMAFAFGEYVLDVGRRELRRGAKPVRLEPQAFDLLAYLVDHRDRVVSHNELLEAIWSGRAVSDAAITTRINVVRRAIGDDGSAQRLIRTLPRKGFRFVGNVEEEAASRAPGSSETIAAAMGERGSHTVAPRLSIVVLPFTNLSGDPNKQHVVDGITENLTTDLSRIANMMVISRNTAFTYRGKVVDTKQIGRELGVRYVLEGSVQQARTQLRVTAQLIDAETDTHVWAGRLDRDAGDLFTLQDEITGQIANTLNLELVAAEAGRPTPQPEALDYIFRGRATYHHGPGRDTSAEAISYFERALTCDPSSTEAMTRLANALVERVQNALSDAPAGDLARVKSLVDQALAISPNDRIALVANAHWLKSRGRYEEASHQYERLIALNRNSVTALANLGQCKIMMGLIDDGIALEEYVLRLSPRDPFSVNRYAFIGLAHLLQSRLEEAMAWLEKARGLGPGLHYIRARLASGFALMGDFDRAVAELAEAQRLVSDDRYSSITRYKTYFIGGYLKIAPKVRALYEATYFVGLRRAGIPEE
jgi:TolB-like protein